MSKKMEEVRDAGVRVVADAFLTDIKSSGKALQELVSLHAISPWGVEVKVENQASSVTSKSGALATKSTGKVKEEQGKQWDFSVKLLKGSVSFISERVFLYCIIAGGSKGKKMKLTVKGGAAVDPDSGNEAFFLLSFVPLIS